MRYLSEDGKVFNTECECCAYEQEVLRRTQEKEREVERRRKRALIDKTYTELKLLIKEYRDEYGVVFEGYFSPFPELLEMLYR